MDAAKGPSPVLDADVVDKFKASGDGWQTRINDALKSWVQTPA